jgi:hypothetical protein
MAIRSCPCCGRAIPVNRFACHSDWRRLPYTIRKGILDAYNARDWPAHDVAKKAAEDWYAANKTSP